MNLTISKNNLPVTVEVSKGFFEYLKTRNWSFDSIDESTDVEFYKMMQEDYFIFCMKKLPIQKAKEIVVAGKKVITEYSFFPAYEKELKNN